MGKLTPTSQEINLLQRMFEEKLEAIGVDAKYYEVKDHKLDSLAKYDEMTYYDPENISLLFEEMPNPKTLRNLSWWDDSDETTPPIAYLPWHRDKDHQILLKPCVGSKIEITDPISKFSRFFEIQEVNANTLYLVYYIVKLSPMREELKMHGTENTTAKPSGGAYEFINK